MNLLFLAMDFGFFPTNDFNNILGGTSTILYYLGILILFGIYAYISSAYQSIGKKSGVVGSGIAWIPVIGPLVIIYQSSRKSNWPFIMLVLINFLFLILIPFLFKSIYVIYALVIIYICVILTFLVMNVIWHWKAYEKVEKPGYWILIPIAIIVLGYLISLINTKLAFIFGGILGVGAFIVHLILIGIAGFDTFVPGFED